MKDNKTWDEIYDNLKASLVDMIESEQNMIKRSTNDGQHESALRHSSWWHDCSIRLNMLELVNVEIKENNALSIDDGGMSCRVNEVIKDITEELLAENKRNYTMIKGIIGGEEGVRGTLNELTFTIQANNYTLNILQAVLSRLGLKDNIGENAGELRV